MHKLITEYQQQLIRSNTPLDCIFRNTYIVNEYLESELYSKEFIKNWKSVKFASLDIVEAVIQDFLNRKIGE